MLSHCKVGAICDSVIGLKHAVSLQEVGPLCDSVIVLKHAVSLQEVGPLCDSVIGLVRRVRVVNIRTRVRVRFTVGLVRRWSDGLFGAADGSRTSIRRPRGPSPSPPAITWVVPNNKL